MTRHDVVIIGGGLSGATLAVALARLGLSVGVVEQDPPETRLAPGFDGRCIAVALASGRMLGALGMWPDIAADAEPIHEIRVVDGGAGVPPGLFLHFDQADLRRGDPLGHMVENIVLRRAAELALARDPGITAYCPAAVREVAREGALARVALVDGRVLRAPLLVAADGKDSDLRASAGIRLFHRAYGQRSICAVVGHDDPHGSIAHEIFLGGGPFAILPMTTTADCHRSAVVWTERDDQARALEALPDAQFLAVLGERFGDFLGGLRLIGGRHGYPLTLGIADSFIAPRLALVGDAAHRIHPLAGQGLNVGWRDIAALTEVIADAARLGLDIGTPSVLRRYEAWRRSDAMLMGAVTDGLDRLFSNDLAPLRLVRSLGLAAVNRVRPLKRVFMRQAMGLGSNPPRLLLGQLP